MEVIHLKTGQRISYRVVQPWDICLAVKVKLCIRVKMVMERTRSMIRGDLERLELIMTTGRLSHQKQIRLPDQWGPQRRQAI